MSKYLIKASYTPEGTKGLLKEGGTGRRNYIEKFINELGGSLDGFYFAFGEVDAFVIVDLPDTTTAAALSGVINASGMVKLTTIPLLTPEEVDNASKKSIRYRAPGQ